MMSMKRPVNIIIASGVILLVLNFLAGILLSAYNTFNMLLNSAIIVVTVTLSVISVRCTGRDAFRVSLPYIFSVCGLIQFILAIFSPSGFRDNYMIIAILLLIGLEVSGLVSVILLSRQSK